MSLIMTLMLFCPPNNSSSGNFYGEILSHSLCRRCLKAGTLPAILRRLTTLQTTSQSEIWTLLLHLRTFSHKKNILEFLFHRFSNDTAKANMYAASLSADLPLPCSDDIPTDPTLAIVDWLFEVYIL